MTRLGRWIHSHKKIHVSRIFFIVTKDSRKSGLSRQDRLLSHVKVK